MVEETPADDVELIKAAEALEPFLAANPHSRILRSSEGGPIRIDLPWGDPSLAIDLPEDSAALIGQLNSLILPERLSALWHRDQRALEVVWSARKLIEPWQEVKDRAFTFEYQGKTHECSFSLSSESLLSIAGNIAALSTSETHFRNMQSFSSYVYAKAKGHQIESFFDKPRSFWIHNVDWDEGAVIDLAEHLNFYMTYYDARSPVVIIHEPNNESADVVKRTRYLRGTFPNKIAGRPLDQNLLTFWSSARAANVMMSFILYYRIIEYCASHYIDNGIRSQLRKIIAAPDLAGSMNDAVDQIVGAFNVKTLDEVPRFKATVRGNVDPAHIWQDVKANLDSFSTKTTFDGGFTVKALVSNNLTEESFCELGLDQFSDTIRKIRNTLSHGKDQETAGMILPTSRNMELLRPWVHLIATAAGEVVLYKDVS